MFDGIGLWPEIAAEAEPIREIRVADDNSPLFLHYDSADLGAGGEGVTPLGYIVENRVLRRALLERARALPTLQLLAPGRIAAMEASPTGAVAVLDGGERLRTRLVAAADGKQVAAAPRRRDPRDRVALPPDRHRHDRRACAPAWRHRGRAFPAGGAVRDPADDGGNLVRRSCGPRMPTSRRACWPCRKPNSPPSCAPASAISSGAIEPVGPRWSYPLALMQAERYVARRLALVGDAAHVIHPIAGQGLNIGIRDIAALAELIVDARRLGLDIGDAAVLERYQRWRRSDALLLAAVTDGLNRLFSNTIPPVRLGPRSRPRHRQPPAAAEAPPDAARDGHARRPPAARARASRFSQRPHPRRGSRLRPLAARAAR